MGIIPVRLAQSIRRRLRLYPCVILLPVMTLTGLGLAGCGQKGPLFKPSAESAPAASPAPAADDAGADAPRKDTAERKNKEPRPDGDAPD